MNKEILGLVSLIFIFPSCKNNKQNTRENNLHKKPNILFIAVDDLKPMLGCYGDTMIKTPNIDQFANRGIVFTNTHCQQALCGPSRASLLTGLYPDQSRVWAFNGIREENPDIVTLPQYFKKNGYTTINIGKIFDYRTVDRYADSISWNKVFPVSEDDYTPHYYKETGPAVTYHFQSPAVKKKYYQYREEALAKGENPISYSMARINPATECVDVPDNAYKDGIFTDLAIQDIVQLAREDKPFFLAIGFHKPHLPFVAPKKYWDLYQREKILLSENPYKAENAVDFAYNKGGHINSYTDENGDFIYNILRKDQPLPPAEQRKLIHGYMACVSFIDEQVGRLMESLRKNNLLENTIIILWGDHGYHLGDHNQWGKSTNFEQATRSPLIIAGPGIQCKRSALASEFTDIYPTLCELAGLEQPGHLQGESLVPVMKGDPNETFAYSQFPRGDKMGYAIRDSRYRYVEWIEEGPQVTREVDFEKVVARQLFDYEKDPWEKVNLADMEEYSDIQNRLAKQLDQFYQSKCK